MTKQLGNLGEGLACEYLVENGFNILEKNWRIKFGKKTFGEIDIIAKKKFTPLNKILEILNFAKGQNLFNRASKTIHFIEVKTIVGSNENFFPEDRVDYKKQKKLRQLAQIWLDKNGFLQSHPHQIDVIGILVNENSDENKIHHFQNVVEG